MADPLSIASGTAGLISLGIEVTKILFKFYNEYKDQGAELASVTKKLDGLQSLLKTLDAAVEEQRQITDTQNQLHEVDKNIQNCEEAIKELQTECEKFCKDSAVTFKDRVRVAGRRAAYPFRRSTIEKLEEDVDDIRENLEFALSILNVKNQSQIQNEILGVKALLERVNASQVSSSIINWLRAPDANANHYTAHDKCHPSTGLWFINCHEFQTWLEEPNSFLWLNGFAGCGKSVLCSTAIQHTLNATKHKHRAGIAFYYFSFNEEAKQDDHGMLRTLLLQLSVQLEDGERDLENLHEKYKSGSPPLYALFESLQHFIERFQDTYILIDALDESPRSNYKRDAVLKAIDTIRNWKIPGVHLLVTSRNEQDIRTCLEPSHNHDILLRNPDVDRDIENFVSHQLRDDIKLQRWKEHHDEIQERLTQGAQGV